MRRKGEQDWRRNSFAIYKRTRRFLTRRDQQAGTEEKLWHSSGPWTASGYVYGVLPKCSKQERREGKWHHPG